MVIENLQSWIESARSAAQILRVQRAPRPQEATPAVPALTSGPIGLRGMEHTQDIDALETKGLIIDRYL